MGARPVRFDATMRAMTQLRFVVVPKESGARLDAGTRTSVRA